MRMKKIGIIVGASALVASAVTLTSCGSDSYAIELKSYKTESTEDVIEKAYDSFIAEKKTSSYDLTVYENNESNIKQDKNESKISSSIARVETYNAITSVLYTLDERNVQAESAYEKTNQAMRVEKIYQNDNGLNTIINLTDKTYTSLAYNASAAKTRTSTFKAENYIDLDDLVDDDIVSTKYYNDDNVYTMVLTYDESKDKNKEWTDDDVKYAKSDVSYEFVFQFYSIDSEYFIGYKSTNKYTITATKGSQTSKTTYDKKTSKYARLFNVTQSIEKFDLNNYKKDYRNLVE